MQVLNIFHVLVAIAMVAFILIQRGPGATAGAAFGSGASGTVFGSRGASSFMSRTTWILAALFCLISMTMAVVVSRQVGIPEEDLGVVGTPTAIEQPVEAVDVPVMAPPASDTDLPSLDLMEDADPEVTGEAGDLPVPDPAAAGSAADSESGGADDAGSGG